MLSIETELFRAKAKRNPVRCFKSGLKTPGVEIICTGCLKHPPPIPRLFQNPKVQKANWN